jgi:hypothetical protein
MKRLKISLIATLAVLILIPVISGFVAAQDTDETFVKGIMVRTDPNDNGTINAGDTVQIAIFVHNNSTETITILYAGVHFDWMPTDNLYGFNMSSYNIQVGSDQDYFFPQQISIKIPTNVNGVHSFYVGIEGVTGSSTPVSLSSDPSEFMVVGSGATPTPTNTNSGSNNPGGLSDIVLYGAIIAVVIIVVVLLLVVFMRRKRRPAPKPAEPTSSQPSPTQPGETPSGQDFSI